MQHYIDDEEGPAVRGLVPEARVRQRCPRAGVEQRHHAQLEEELAVTDDGEAEHRQADEAGEEGDHHCQTLTRI